jgi:outer membrane receptor protein involved in Fe transport
MLIFLTPVAISGEQRSIYDYSLLELMNVKTTPGSLTDTEANRTPASLTLITQQDIINSGARRLDELLDIMVPNLQLVRHNYGPQHVGIRGIVNDRDNTYLFVVNGKAMNEKSLRGVTMERDLPMLGDIRKIEIIRGPGSAVYGPGALSGVVNISTFSGKDFQGTEIIAKQGAIEKFTSLEIKHSMTLGADKGANLMLYYGLTDYSGASDTHTPHIVSVDTEFNGEPYLQAGEPVPYALPNDKGSSLGSPKHKLHIQLDRGDNDETRISAWLRYTKGGNHVAGEHGRDNTEFSRGNQRFVEPAYQQLTAYVEASKQLSNDDELFFNLSYDIVDSDRSDNVYKADVYEPEGQRLVSYREDEYAAKFIYKKEIASVKTALGVEVSYDILGLPGIGNPDVDATTAGIYIDGERRRPDELLADGDWNVMSYAYYGELQWTISDDLTLFSGARYDKHDYTDWFFSPRLSLIYGFSDNHIGKVLYNKSVKTAGEFDLRSAYLDGARASEESLESVEFSYTHIQQQGLTYQATVFAQEIEFWSVSSPVLDPSTDLVVTGVNQPVGTVSLWGGEFEIGYEQDDHKLSLNHSYSKLIDIKQPNDSQYITAHAYGYGDDLNTWSNHISKLFYRWQFKPTWRFTTSVRIYWGFQGAEDYADYNNESPDGNPTRFGYDEKGEAFSGNYYVNLGIHKAFSETMDLSFNAYNVLGWIDKDYNKRNYLKRFSDYRPEAAAVALNLSYRF